MALTLSELRKSRNSTFTHITNALSKTTETGYKKDDDEYFKVTRDKAGNGSAVIRFLDSAEGEELPFVQIYSHSFQGPTGRWYIENCLSTLQQDDPVNVSNRALWAGGDDDKKLAQKRKRKLTYIANIYVISDPSNKDNEGKVFKFKFGKKIFEKVMEKLNPTFEDDTPVNIFDLWEGANFKVRMRQVEGYPNYDQSVFADPSPVAGSDEEILAIVNKQYKLAPLVAPDQFKSYADLDKKFQSVIGGAAPVVIDDAVMEQAEVAQVAAVATKSTVSKAKPTAKPAAQEDEDDLENYFKSLT